MGRTAKSYAHKIRVAHRHWHMVMFIKHGIRDGLNVLADMHKLITSTCVRTTHRNCHRILCITTWIICTDERCVNLCRIICWIILPNLMPYAEFRWIEDCKFWHEHNRSGFVHRATFSRSISSIRSIYTTDTLTYLSVQRAISRQARG